MGTISAPSYAKTMDYFKKKIHTPIYQDIFTYIPQIYGQYIFYMERQ